MIPEHAGEIDPQLDATVDAIIRDIGSDRSRLLDVVQAIQRRYGFISDDAINAVAAGLHMHAVEVEDTVSFYAFLNRTPKGRFHIRLSKTPISLMKGAAEVAQAFAAATGAPIGGTSPDQLFTLEWTSDIGMADQEPSALINATVVNSLHPSEVPAIVSLLLQHGDPSALPNAGARPSLTQPGPVIFCQDSKPGDGIRAALAMSPEDVIHEISTAKLRGRGGAGFPTALKWKLCREAKGDEHYVVCNADEGEPGTFKDRVLLTDLPDLVFDGVTIAAYALGSRKGILYLRGEYAHLWQPLQNVLNARRKSGLLGSNICGRAGFDFDIRIQLGAGSYVCGEESALLDSLEGKRGAPRDRPPFPTDHGYLQQPTAVDNVESHACAARILEHGAAWFNGYGTKESTGTKLLSFSGDCARPGVYEVEYGVTINELLDLVGAPDAAYVQVSGPSGEAVSAKDFGRRMAFEDLGSGGSMMVFGPERDVLDVAHQFMDFFVEESCGWCTPCRVGTTLLKKQLEKIIALRGTQSDVVAMEKLANTVKRMSRCGLGQTAINPILTTIRNFPQLYEAKLQPETFLPTVTLSEAVVKAEGIRQQEEVPA
jgi:[NiFe] hydrogenase diaphorase moiety large subunit